MNLDLHNNLANKSCVSFPDMSRFPQPNRLVQLALDSFGNYVYELGYNLLDYTEDKEKLREVCQHLHSLLQYHVPPGYAHEVTYYLLQRIEHLCFYVPLGAKVKLVRQELASAVIHPAVTKLHLTTCIPSHLPSMTHLRELEIDSIFIKLPEDILLNELCNMVCLETFCYTWFCTDKILHVLGKFCSQIRRLNVSHSRRVTNKCVASIVKFNSLTQLELCNTRISGTGIKRLLKGLSSKLLLSFSCNNMTEIQLKLLANKMPNIRKVKFGSKKCDVSVLKDLSRLENLSLCKVKFKQAKLWSPETRLNDFKLLKYLHILSLTKVKFFRICDILYSIGSQLSELSLQDIKPISAAIIGETCPELKALKILDCEDKDCERQLWKQNRRPLFQLVEEVVILLEYCPYLIIFVLSHCTNVRKVDVGIYGEEDEADPDILENVLRLNHMKRLQEFQTTQKISESNLRKLPNVCPNLCLLSARL
jgi:hypothetical protein